MFAIPWPDISRDFGGHIVFSDLTCTLTPAIALPGSTVDGSCYLDQALTAAKLAPWPGCRPYSEAVDQDEGLILLDSPGAAWLWTSLGVRMAEPGFWDDEQPAGAHNDETKSAASTHPSHNTESCDVKALQSQLASARKQLASKTVALKKATAQADALQRHIAANASSNDDSAPESDAATCNTDNPSSRHVLEMRISALHSEQIALAARLESRQRRVAELEAAVDAAEACTAGEQAARVALETASTGELEVAVSDAAVARKAAVQAAAERDAALQALRSAEARLPPDQQESQLQWHVDRCAVIAAN